MGFSSLGCQPDDEWYANDLMIDGVNSREFLTEVDLDHALLDAHASKNNVRLVELYRIGAELKAAVGESESAAFLYTQAYVFALETGHPFERELRQKLIELGREVPD